MTFDIYAYFNTEQLALLIDAIAAFTASAGYLDLIKMVVMLGFIVLIAGLALGKDQDPFEFFRWLIAVTIITSVLLVPKVNVIILDRTGSSAPVAKANVPIGFAFFASVTSHVGDYLTRSFETIFALPTDLQFQKNGIMFGNTVLTETLKVGITDPVLQKDMLDFVNNCTYYDILANRIDPITLSQTDDIWAGLSNTSLTLRTAYASDPTGSMACDDAYTGLTTRLVVEVNKQSTVLGRKLNPKAVNNAVAQTLLTSQISNSYATLTTISKSSTEILRQAMMANTIRSSQMASAQRLNDASAAIVGSGQAEAEITANTNYLIMARVAERAAPAIRNAVEIIIYAVFPIILVMLLVAPVQSGPILKNYILTMLWVQIIPALYAVLNFVMVSASYVKLKGIVDGYAATNVTLQSIGDLSQQGLSDMAIGGYLTLLIPAIAYAIIKTGEVGGAALFTGAMSGASGAASSASSALTKGNIDQGLVNVDNQNMNNQNLNKSDATPSVTSGFTRFTNAQGTTTTSTDGSTRRYQSNQSSLPIDASTGMKTANSLSSEASRLSEQSNRLSESAVQSTASTFAAGMALTRGHTSNYGTDKDWGTGKGADAARTFGKLDSLAKQVTESLGGKFTDTLGTDIVKSLSAGASVGFDAKFLKLNAGGNARASRTESGRKDFDAAVNLATQGLSNISADERKAATENFKLSDVYREAERNDTTSAKIFNSSKLDSDTYTKAAESARSESKSMAERAQTVRDNWNTMSGSWSNYLADRLIKEGQMETFNNLSQSNPEAALAMAARYVNDLNPNFGPSKPVVSNLEELTKGTNFDKPLATNPGVANTTNSTAAANNRKVISQGFRGQSAKGSSLQPTVNAEVNTTEAQFQGTQAAIQKENNASRNSVASATGPFASDTLLSPDVQTVQQARDLQREKQAKELPTPPKK